MRGTHCRPAGLAARIKSLAGALACVALLGCASGSPQVMWHETPLRGHPRVAMLPLENLTGRAEASANLSQILFVQLVRTGTCDVVESGVVNAALDSVRVLNTGALTSEQVRELGSRLNVDLILTGTVLESTVAKTPDGDLPSIGVALKLLDARTAKVRWAAMDSRSGDDHETLFGWGVQRNYEKLAEEMAAGLFKDFPALAAEAPAGKTEGAKK